MSDKPSMLFDPDSELVRHTKKGVWVYEDVSGSRKYFQIPSFSEVSAILQAIRDPYVARLAKDMASIDGIAPWLALFTMANIAYQMLPSITLWYSTQLLNLIQVSLGERRVDKAALFRAAFLRVFTSFLRQALRDTTRLSESHLTLAVESHFSFRLVKTHSTLDLQLRARSTARIVWPLVTRIFTAMFSATAALSQVTLLLALFWNHREGRMLAFFVMGDFILQEIGALTQKSRRTSRRLGVRVFKTTDDDFIQSKALREINLNKQYRREIVSGGLSEALSSRYKDCLESIGDKETNEPFIDGDSGRIEGWVSRVAEYMRSPVLALGQIYTCSGVMELPASVPFSLATLQLVHGQSKSLSYAIRTTRRRIDDIHPCVDYIREFYDYLDAPNQVLDGDTPFPKNQSDLSNGISVEFRNVSFKYPGTDTFVLKNVSFKVEQGQLCIIVGENGSGKSTILNLMNRMYDTTEGEIMLNGQNIRTLRLADLRKATGVLFQDYSIFPMSLAQNIGYGDPANHENMNNIREAARLGGASDFIEKTPYQYNTLISLPRFDHSASYTIPISSAFAGRTIDFSKLKLNDRHKDFSGGQKQRIALSRLFMKSLVSSDSNVGLLSFDEPSASLDPKAEHDLLTRLRDLRGSKTMVFSTHRFGKLTRYADLILYVHDGQILEAGSHAELFKMNGEYATVWNLQAQDFHSAGT
ncbi:HlyB/MsbA family ABC transporter [Ephemerocybe angulata]|uniref:HlyB/MsbA family ABC transporter n=1 Tax=Ephemerocybe angulata TaxID=980116 RepID=A0A8H6HL62_9AGAR|nr:HlyB/MsbA family ABC transporter [Tulosesus angulatus]